MPGGPPVALRETMRVQNRRVPLAHLHGSRLRAGGSPDAVVAAAIELATAQAALWEPAYGRLSLTVRTDGTVSCELSEAPSTIDVPGGPTIAFVDTPEPALPPGAAKPADRTPWDRALAVAQEQGADIAVLLGPGGEVYDTSQATIWLRVGDELITPPSPPALRGVSRSFVAAHLMQNEGSPYHFVERVIARADVEAADEVILTTAVGGARAVRGRDGEAAAWLRAAFDRAFGLSTATDS